jgi:hypothetical protein
VRWICLFLALLAFGPAANAYEGAGIGHEEAAPPPPPPPKLTKAPTVIHVVDAGWPAGVPFTDKPVAVVLIIEIDATGHVPKAEVKTSAGEAFDVAARKALLASEFTPAELDGKPGPVRLEFSYKFLPPPKPPPPPAVPPPPVVNLRGRVLERGSRDPLYRVLVGIPATMQQAETDAQGRFEMAGLPPGEVTLVVVAPGHDRLTTKVSIAPGKQTEVTLYVWKSLGGAQEIVIRGENNRSEASQHVIEGAELTNVPGTRGDPLRVLQSLPGVARPSFVSGALLVRGAQPQDTTILFDGVTIPLLYHFGQGPSVINPSFIDAIDFFPGAYGADYGRAIAGAVDVKTKPRAAARVHGKVDINFLDASFYLEGPAWDPKYGSWAIAARRSYIDLFLPTLLSLATKPGQASIVAAPIYWDWQARYDVSIGHHHLALVGFGSNDTLKLAEAGSTNTLPFSLNMSQGFERGGLRWTWTPDETWTFVVAPTIGTTLNGTQIGNPGLGNAISLSTNSLDLNLRAHVLHVFEKGLSFQFGIDGIRSSYTNEFTSTPAPQPGTPNPSPVTTQTTNLVEALGTYVEMVWKPIEKVRIVPGLRFETYGLPSGVTGSVEPRINVRWDILKNFAVKAGWGLFSQAPQPGDLSTFTGNPNLGLEHSNQTAAGFEWRILPPLVLDVQGFFNLRTGLVVDTTDYILDNGMVTPIRKNNSGYGRTYGLEVLLKHEITKQLFGWIAYTLSRSEQWDPNTRSYQPVSTDQTHILSVVASWHFVPEWEVGLRLQYTSGDPITPVVGATFDADTGNFAPLQGNVASVRGPYFFQMDLRAEHYWTFPSWKLSLYLDIQNVTNSPNPQLTIYDYRYQQSATVNGLPFLPYIGITAGF